MKKRSLTAILMTAVLSIGMCMPVFAAEGDVTGDGSTIGSGELKVSYEAATTYTVNIPSTITATSTVNTYTITLQDGALLGKGKVVKITPTNLKNNKLPLKLDADTSIDIDFTLSAGSSDELKPDSKTCAYSIGAVNANDISYAGKYEGSVTFQISYDDATPTA